MHPFLFTNYLDDAKSYATVKYKQSDVIHIGMHTEAPCCPYRLSLCRNITPEHLLIFQKDFFL